MRIDLHAHSTASDGQLPPSALVQHACALRLDILAITDHDTTDAIPAAQAASSGRLLIIPGIELSAEDQGRDVHMLGYFLRWDDAVFQARLRHFREDRLRRAERIVARLGELGLPLAWERVLAQAGGGAVGRPHIARALVEAGHLATTEDAFSRYLYTGGPAYVPRERLAPEEAINLIHSVGGAAVMAHPAVLPNYAAMVERLAPAGLDGVEVVHPLNTLAVRENLRGLARRFNLVQTGGSDFHGPDSEPLGSVTPPPGCVEALRERAARYTPRD